MCAVEERIDSPPLVASARRSSVRGDSTWSKDTPPTPAVAGVIGLHVGLALVLAATLNVWLEDAFSLETTDHGIARATRQAIRFELQPPGYFSALAAWRSMNDSILFARLFSVSCSAGMLFVLGRLASRWLPGVSPIWVVGFAACNPFVVWAAIEIRCYALVMLLAAGLLLLFHDGWLRSTPRRSARIGYVVAAAVGLYTFYYLGFLLVANAGVLVVERRWRGLLGYLGAMGAVAVLALPLVGIVPGQFEQHYAHESATSVSIPGAAKIVAWRIENQLLPLHRVVGPTVAAWFWRVVLLAGAIACVARGGSSFRRPLTVVALSSVPYVLLVLLDPLGTADLRHTAPLFVPAVLALFGGLSVAAGRRTVAVVAGLLAVVNLSVVFVDYSPRAKSGDWIRVATWVTEQVREEEPVLVFPATQALPLARYYEDRARLVPLPQSEDFERYDPHEYALTTGEEIDAAILAAGRATNRVIVVRTAAEPLFGVDLRGEVLDEWIASRYRIVARRPFHGSEAVILERRGVLERRSDEEAAVTPRPE